MFGFGKQDGLKNKKGSSPRYCSCGTWEAHWTNNSGEPWPGECAVEGCSNAPTIGTEIIVDKATGEQVVPVCDACGALKTFKLKEGVKPISADKLGSCKKANMEDVPSSWEE